MNEDPLYGMYLAHGSMFILGLVMQIAFFVVALTTVRRASPEASNLMITASVIHFLCTLLGPIATFFVSRLYGMEDMVRMNTITMVVLGLIGIAAGCLQLVGIVRVSEARQRSGASREP
ncbi:MAG: hypothetical protein J0L92_08465 [Deltaproteobacteria bacterium]|nr:hypothetical protein [Deltaproteobacteria bacterium]